MLNTFFYFTHTIQWLASFLYIYLFTSTLPSCPYREKVADFYQNAKNTSVALHASQDIHKLQVRQNMPHRIYTKYKWRRTCLTGYTQITSAAQRATQDLHKLQVVYVLPSQKAVGNRFSYPTGSTQITSGPCPLHFLPIKQLVTDSNTSQDNE